MRTQIFERVEFSLILASRGELIDLRDALQKAHFAMFRQGDLDEYRELICELHSHVEARLNDDLPK